MAFPRLEHPIVQAPMAGGPARPALAAAVSGAGGLGFLAAGYRAPERLREDVAEVRQLGAERFGVNLFRIEERPVDEAAVARYAASLGPDAGEPRFEDDDFAAKVELVADERVPVVSFTFGCPPAAAVEHLQAAGAAVWATVTEVEEAVAARAAGADALVVQGVEAGGHRGGFDDEDGAGELGLLALLRLVAREVELPLVAAGGIADGAGVAAVLAAGARAAQVGTAFLRCPEAGTSRPHRDALARPGRTALTRAFSGRRARAIENRFLREHRDAPSAYPHVQHVTARLRAAAREAGDAEALALWAGQAFSLAEEVPAAELVRRLGADARAALDAASARLRG
ncbi:MAG TPA: nitronate monooxygenase [Gaiellaceae bacterium]|nr:nitronate monooxygenase [Gaiellaceae bacterium]